MFLREPPPRHVGEIHILDTLVPLRRLILANHTKRYYLLLVQVKTFYILQIPIELTLKGREASAVGAGTAGQTLDLYSSSWKCQLTDIFDHAHKSQHQLAYSPGIPSNRSQGTLWSTDLYDAHCTVLITVNRHTIAMSALIRGFFWGSKCKRQTI